MNDYYKLMLFGIIAIFSELAIVRTFSTTISGASYYANMLLLGTIFAYLLGFNKPGLAKYFPFIAPLLFIIYLVAVYFGQYNLVQTITDEFLWTSVASSVKQKTSLDIHLVVFCLMLSTIPFMFFIGAKVSNYFNILTDSRKAYLLLSLGCLFGGILFFIQNQFAPNLASMYVVLSILISLAIFLEDIKGRYKVMLAIILILLNSFVMTYSIQYLWSPYQKISVVPTLSNDNYAVFSNDTYILSISAKPSKGFDIHQVPFESALKKTDEVLILGSGGGTADVREALIRGSEHITAVEIDPTFVELGKAIDTYKTYYNDKVSLIIEDARNYLNNTDNTFDFIYFPFLDSQVTVTNSNRFRLDSFLFTREGLQQAYDKLNDDGVLFINFCSSTPWLKQRFFDVLLSIDDNVRAYYKSNSCWMLYVVSKGREVSINRNAYDSDLTDYFKQIPPLTIPTDDWPFLYNFSKTIPSDYLKLLIMTFLLFLALVSLVSPIKLSGLTGKSSFINIYGFFSGAAFFFLQLRTISIYIPVFGATYKSQAIVIVATILASLIGSLLSYRFDNKVNIAFVWLLLFLSLINIVLSQYYFPPMATGSFILKLTHFTNYLMPLLLSGYIYLHYLSELSSNEVINIQKYNLLGGVLGGILEPTVVYFGFSVSLFVAFGFYFLCSIPILIISLGQTHVRCKVKQQMKNP